MKKICIVLPCYNEQEVLPTTTEKLLAVIGEMQSQTGAIGSILYVDDGSTDNTWQIISAAAASHDCISGIRLSHNSGHQTAIWAGMEQAVTENDAVVTIDADLQDDELAIIDMARQFGDGCDIVYGVRKERKQDSFFKRNTALGFYRIMKSVDHEIIYNHADFRLMSRRAVEALMQYPERNIFLRGLVRKLGFTEGYTYYDRKQREAGESKYPLGKMMALCIDAITSFSVTPINIITFLGLFISVVAIIMILYALVSFFTGNAMQGWTSILISLWFLGGITITGIGVAGTYIGKIYTEVKRRPRYFVQDRV
jgi:glycosyltransferase involved in cell wall biosynthesis